MQQLHLMQIGMAAESWLLCLLNTNLVPPNRFYVWNLI